MQALLVLYMVGQLLTPGHIEHVIGFADCRAGIEYVTGHLSTQALASQIFGLYVGFVYFTPMIGGLIGDRFLGRRNSVALGALLMTAGHFSMAFDESFFVALLLLIVGAGLLRGNLLPQVGELYDPQDRRRAFAFQLYGAVINLGAFIAPLVTGFLGQTYGWHFGFGFAGVGMLIGLAIYLAGQGELPASGRRVQVEAAPSLHWEEWRAILFLSGLVPVSALFWVAQSQVWNTYNLWVRDHIQLHIMGWPMPIPWLQSLDGLAPFIMLPPLLLFWRWQAARNREPNEYTKAAIGCLIFGISTFWLGCAGGLVDATGRTPLIWAVVFHFASNLGWLFFTPTMNAIYSRVAPPSVNATMMGVNTISVFVGSVASGRLGGLYERMSPFAFWTIHAALVSAAGVILLAIGFNRWAVKPNMIKSTPL
jgi:POT family proton-dependent oligopeptide transporter